MLRFLMLFSCFSFFVLCTLYAQYEQGFNNRYEDNGRPPCWGEGYGTFSVRDTFANLNIAPYEGAGAYLSGGDPSEGFAAVRSPFFEVNESDFFSFYYNVNGHADHTLRMAVFVQPYHDSVQPGDLDYGLGEPLSDTLSFQYNPSSWYLYEHQFDMNDTVRLVIKFFDIPAQPSSRRPVVDYLSASANINGDVNSPQIRIEQTNCYGKDKSFFAAIYRGDGSQDTSFPLLVSWYLNGNLVYEGEEKTYSYMSYDSGDVLQASFFAYSPCQTDASADPFPWFSQRLHVEDCTDEFAIQTITPNRICAGDSVFVAFRCFGSCGSDSFLLEIYGLDTTPYAGIVYGASSDSLGEIAFVVDSTLEPGTHYLRVVTQDSVYSSIDSITINPMPVVEIRSSIDRVNCRDSIATLEVDYQAAYLYQWSTTEQTPIIQTSPLADSSYSVTVTDDQGCFASDTFLLRSNFARSPALDTAWVENSCSGDTAWVSVGATHSGARYVVSYIDAVILSDSFEQGTGGMLSFPFLPSTDTHVVVYAEDSSSFCGSLLDTLFVEVYEKPVLVTQDILLRKSQDTLLSVAASGGTLPYHYRWEPSAWLQEDEESKQYPRTKNLIDSTTFFVLLTDSQGCTANDSLQVNVVDTSFLDIRGRIISADSVICVGDSVRLEVDVSGGEGSIHTTWSVIYPSAFFLSDERSVWVQPSDTNRYVVQVSDDIMMRSDTLTLFAVSLPEASITTDHVACEGYHRVISASGGDSYRWSSGDTSASFAFVLEDTLWYYLTVTSEQGCSTYDSILVEPLKTPHVDLVDSIRVFYQEDTSFAASLSYVGASGATLQWEPTNLIASTSNAGLSVRTTALTQSAWFYLTVRDNESACVWSDSLYVFVDTQSFQGGLWPLFLSGIDTNLCKGDSLVLSSFALNGSGRYSFYWLDDETYDTISTDSILRFHADSSIQLRLLVSDQDAVLHNSIRVVVHDLPAVFIQPGDGDYLQGKSVVFTASGGRHVTWENNPFIESTLYSRSVSVRPLEETMLFVKVADDYGCQSEDSVFLRVSSFNWFVPEAFTPNDDGLNDRLFVYGNGIKKLDFRVFNKWGQLVFQTEEWFPDVNRSAGWNGIFQGSKQHNQTFGWMLIMEDLQGEKYRKKGTVILLR